MKISIQELWHNCKIHLETNLFENNGVSLEWLSQITPLRQYLNEQNNHQEVIEIYLPDSGIEQEMNSTTPVSNELAYESEEQLSPKKLKKLKRLSEVLYQVDNEYNIQPTSFVQSYFQHKTYTDKAQLESKIQNFQSVSYTSPIDQKVKTAFKNWRESGFKYEYEQILYFFNQMGTLVPTNLSNYFSTITGLPKINFKYNTYLPFSQINTADIWSSIQFPYKKAANRYSKFSFDFAQIPIVNSYFPSSNKNSSSSPDDLLSRSILLLRNVLFEGQPILLEESHNLEDPIIVGFKYEKIVH